MFLLDWRLTLFALALLPLFVWLTKRVGDQRRKVAKVRQESMADISSLVQESLSVSGILLGKTMGRAGELAARFENESARLADLEVRSRMTGPLDDGVDPDDVRGHARARLPLRRPLRGRRLARHGDRVHHAADAALLPDRLAARRLARRPDLARALRPRLRVPRPAGRHRGGDAHARDAAGRRRLRRRLVPLRRRRLDAAGRLVRGAARARRRRSSARPAPARRPPATSSRGSTTSREAASRSTASTSAS